MALKKNVGNLERAASVLLGGLALAQAAKAQRGPVSRSLAGSAGAALLWRGLSGNCPVYSGLDFSSASDPLIKPQTIIERSALVNRPLEEVKAFLEKSRELYGKFVPTGSDIYEIELDGRLWMLNLHKHVDDKRTLIRMSWDDHVEAHDGKDGLPALRDPAPRILELRKLKSLLETGEIPTIEGQSHGERSRFGKMVENFGDFLIEKIQSRSALPEEPILNQDTRYPSQTTYYKEANA